MRAPIIILSAIMLTACAGANYRPMVDRPGPNYEADLRDCQEYAKGELQADQAAVIGAVLGALFGAAVGHNTGYAGQLAAAGALGGASGGAAGAQRNQTSIIQRCMSGRGYTVLR